MRVKTHTEKQADLPTTSDIKNTFEGKIFIESRRGNINGDLNAGGGPKVDPVSGENIMSGEAIRRMVRNYWIAKFNCDPPNDVFMRNRETAILDGEWLTLDDQVQRARESIGLGLSEAYLESKQPKTAKKGKKSEDKKDEGEKAKKGLPLHQQRLVRSAVAARCLDVRTFGIMGGTGSDRFDSMVMPLSIFDGISVHPVIDLHVANTRSMVSSHKELEKRGQSIANRTLIRYALIEINFTLSAQAARVTGMMMWDFIEALEALVHGWILHTGPHRRIVLRDMFLFEGPALGCRPAKGDWDDVVKAVCKLDNPIEANGIEDFEITVDASRIPSTVKMYDHEDIMKLIASHEGTQEAAE